MEQHPQKSSTEDYKQNLFLFMLFFAMLVLLQACSPGMKAVSASDGSSRVIQGSISGSGTATGSNNSSAGNKDCQGSEMGYVYESSSQSGTSFRQSVADFVSIELSPESLGEVSGVYGASNGVQMRLRLRFNASGQVVSGDSYLELTINDSYVGQSDSSGNVIEPYIAGISSVKSGTYNSSTKQMQILFADEYGEVSVQGRIVSEEIQGTIQFTNFIAYDGSMPRSGTLGNFKIPACSIGQ